MLSAGSRKRFEVIELEIDWEDKPALLSQTIPKAAQVPAEARQAISESPNLPPDLGERAVDEQRGEDEEAHSDRPIVSKRPTVPGLGNPPRAR